MDETSGLDWQSEKPDSSPVSGTNLLCDLGRVSPPLWTLGTKLKDLSALVADSHHSSSVRVQISSSLCAGGLLTKEFSPLTSCQPSRLLG